MFNYLTNRKQFGKIGYLSVVKKLSIYNWKCMSRKIVFLSIFLSSFFLPGEAMASFINRINWPNVLVGICSLAPLSNSFPCPYASSSKPKRSLYSAERLSTVSFDKFEKSLNKKPSWAESSWYGAVAYQMLKPLMYYFLPMSLKQFERLVETERVCLGVYQDKFSSKTEEVKKIKEKVNGNIQFISVFQQDLKSIKDTVGLETTNLKFQVQQTKDELAGFKRTWEDQLKNIGMIIGLNRLSEQGGWCDAIKQQLEANDRKIEEKIKKIEENSELIRSLYLEISNLEEQKSCKLLMQRNSYLGERFLKPWQIKMQHNKNFH